MHTHTTFPYLAERERRVIAREGYKPRHFRMEDVERAEARAERDDPVNRLRSNTERTAEAVQGIKVRFMESLGHLDWLKGLWGGRSRYDSRIERAIDNEAERRLATDPEAQAQLATGLLGAIFRRGKRRLRVALKNKLARQIADDIRSHIESDDPDDRFGRLQRALKSGRRISLKSAKERGQLFSALGRIEQRLQTRVDGDERRGSISPELQELQNSEEALREKLSDLGVITEEEASDQGPNGLFARNAQKRDKVLLKRVESDADLRNDPELRDTILENLRQIRSRSKSTYRLLKLTEADPNRGTVTERLERLANDPTMRHRRVRLALGLDRPVEACVRLQENGDVFLRDSEKRIYAIGQKEKRKEDLPEGESNYEVSYRDASGNFHDVPINKNTFSVN